MEETPKRPLAHATLSGSFVLVFTVALLSLVVSLFGTGLGWFEPTAAHILPHQSSEVLVKKTATHGKWRSLATAVQQIETANANAGLNQKANASQNDRKRRFETSFIESVDAAIESKKVDVSRLLRLYLEFESHYLSLIHI